METNNTLEETVQSPEETNIFIRLQKRRERRRLALLVTLTAIFGSAVLGVGGYYGIYYGYITHAVDYEVAQRLLDEGKYDEAAEAFSTMEEFGDSKSMVTECYYEKAVNYYETGDYKSAVDVFTELGDYKDSKYNIALIYKDHPQMKEVEQYGFGKYAGTVLKWKVLATESDRMLMVTEDIVDTIQYNEETCEINWQDCTSRRWLNSEFYVNAFDREERKEIVSVNNLNPSNPDYGTIGCDDTKDKVFFLSIDEAQKYFKDDSDRLAKATDYAEMTGVFYNSANTANWWLRSPGSIPNFAAVVTSLGKVSTSGVGASNHYTAGVRPAVWIKI